MGGSSDYEALKAAGLCVRCRGELPGGHRGVTCSECRARLRENTKRRYGRLKAEGVCPLCRSPVEAGRTVCVVCNEGHLIRRRLTAQRRAAEGLCKSCGKSPPDVGRVRCGACNAESALAYRARRSAVVEAA